MRRRRQETLWIHRWSRPLIGLIAAIGASGTGYLTAVKLMNKTAACVGGCDRVLASKWATVFGLPLTLFGALAYLSMLILAVAPLLVNEETNKDLRSRLEGITWPLLFVGATGMMVFSGFLMYVLATDIQLFCIYCVTSALLTLSMFLLAVLGRRWEDRGRLLFTGAIVAILALVGTFGMYAAGGQLGTGPQTAENLPENAGAPITTPSSEAEIALAKHLKDSGAKMYGLYWCPHCHDQKQLFGQEAAKQIPYIECAPEGYQSQTALCQSVPEVKGFPTWEIKGQFLSGTQSLETLATASDYEGPTSFINGGGGGAAPAPPGQTSSQGG